jgi:hypothetical protein
MTDGELSDLVPAMRALSNRLKLQLSFDIQSTIFGQLGAEWWNFRTILAWAIIRDFNWGVNVIATGKILGVKRLDHERVSLSAQKAMMSIADEFSQYGLMVHLSPIQAEGQLITALRRGEVAAKGFLHDELQRMDIDPSEWTDLKIVDGWATRYGESVWHNILFRRSDIEHLFPPIAAAGGEVVDAGESEDTLLPVVEVAFDAAPFPAFHPPLKYWLLDRQVTDHALLKNGSAKADCNKSALYRKLAEMSCGQAKEDTIRKVLCRNSFWD